MKFDHAAVLAWLKSHVLIVVFGVLTVVLPVAGIVGSGIWNGGIKAKAEETYKTTDNALSSSERVNYSVPSVREGGVALEDSRAPHDRITATYKAELDLRTADVSAALEAAVEFNRKGREPLIEDLFPQPLVAPPAPVPAGEGEGVPPAPAPPPELDRRKETRLVRDMVRALTGNAGFYPRMFARLGAGGPMTDAEIRVDLTNRSEDRKAEIRPDGSSLTEEELALVRDELVQERLYRYRDAARDVGVYADPRGVLGAVVSEDARALTPDSPFSTVPFEVSESDKTAEAFVWQWDAWVIGDILEAIGRANLDVGLDAPLSVIDAPVKRILEIRVAKVDLPPDPNAAGALGGLGSGSDLSQPSSRDPRGGFSFGGPAAAPSGPLQGPRHTGRGDGSAPSSGSLDFRRALVRIVVDSARLPSVLDEFRAGNLATVIALDVDERDVWSDLRSGYDYGDDHVVEATIELETAWVRAWTEPLMPPRVKQAVGAGTPGF